MRELQLKEYSFKALFIVLLALYSMVPCAVKDTLYHSIGITYAKPLHKSQSAVQLSQNCDTAKVNIGNSVVVKNYQKAPFFSPFCYGSFIYDITYVTSRVKTISTTTAIICTPPLYILFKRFKFDLV